MFFIFLLTILCTDKKSDGISVRISASPPLIISKLEYQFESKLPIIRLLKAKQKSISKNFEREKLLCVRGGASYAKGEKYEENSDDDVDVEIESDEEESFHSEEAEVDPDEDYFDEHSPTVADADFKEESLLQRAVTAWNKTPPITMSFISISVFVTLASWIFNGNRWPSFLALDWAKATTRLQVWRFFSAFLSFGEFNLYYVLTLQFVWTYMANLEKLSCKEPQDFFVMSVFGMAALLVSYALLSFDTRHLGHNLSTFFVYVWARTYEGQDVRIFEILDMKAELLPWFFVAQTMVLEGALPFTDLLGIAIGHLYHYLKIKKWIKAPSFLENMFQHPFLKSRYTTYEEELGAL